jgi:hypothetical protein
MLTLLYVCFPPFFPAFLCFAMRRYAHIGVIAQ